MGSVDQSSKVVIEGVATIQHLNNHNHADLVVVGGSPEANADRLLLAGEYVGAIGAYEKLGPLSRMQREKLSFAMWARGIDEAWDVLTLDYGTTSFEGLVMQLRAFGGVMWRNEVDDTWLKDFALTVIARDDLKSKDAMLAATIYIAASLSRYRFREELYPEVCVDAVRALKELNSRYYPCLEAFALGQKARFNEVDSSALIELVSKLEPSKTPVIGFGFVAAVRARNPHVAKAFVSELCRRYLHHPHLSNTVAVAAVQARDPGILDEAPEDVRNAALQHAEVQLLIAMTARNTGAVEKALSAYASTSDEKTLRVLPVIHEPFFKLSWRTWDEGTWSVHPSLTADWCVELAELLPAGEARDRVLMECGMATESDTELLFPFLCELFNRKPTAEVADLFPDSVPFDGVSASALAQFIFDHAIEDDPYCSLVDPEFDPEIGVLIERGVPEQLMMLVRQLPEDQRLACVRTLTSWGLFKAPESLVTFAFEQDLRGNNLSQDVQEHLSSIRLAIQKATPDQVIFIQSILDELSIEAKRSTSLAAEDSVILSAFNEVLNLKGRSLTEHGEKRVQDLVKRYGAAKLLPGLRDITKQPQPLAEENLVDTLSKYMVLKQGSLAGRRSYLAGILRKRLVNLKSAWLDQQVSECINKGIDVEQMIELAKTVTTWDEWSAGLTRLKPY